MIHEHEQAMSDSHENNNSEGGVPTDTASQTGLIHPSVPEDLNAPTASASVDVGEDGIRQPHTGPTAVSLAVSTTADDAKDLNDPSAVTAVSTDASATIASAQDGDLRTSPRWNNAAHEATAKGLKPNSKEWLEDVRETLRKLPDLNKRPKPTHPKKDRKDAQGPQGGAPRQERREERPQGQGKKGQGQHTERRERSQGQTGDAYSPGFVNYSAIVSMLLKASRFRRNQYLRSRGEIKTPSEVRDFYTVGFSGTKQSGKSKYLFERFARDWSTSIYIVGDATLAEAMKQFVPEGMKESQINEMMRRVIPAKDALADLNRYSSSQGASAERPKLTIEVDPDDVNPSATLLTHVLAYMEEQRAYKEREPAATHPTLLPLKTVYVDTMVECEAANLNFARLVRYVRLGGQLPEIIVCQH